MCTDNPLCQSRLCANYTMDGAKVQVMEGVEEILGTMTRYLRELNEMGNATENMDDKTKARVKRRSVQVSAEVEDLRDSLQTAVATRLSARQMEMLDFDQREHSSKQHPGEMQWAEIFAKSFKISINVRIFKQKLMDFMEDVDVILLSTILADLASLEFEVEQHTEVIMYKPICQNWLAQNNFEENHEYDTDEDSLQQPYLERPRLNRQMSKSATCLVENKSDIKPRRGIKYKKNKTDSLAYALTNPIPIRTARKTSGVMGHRPSEESLIGYHLEKQGNSSSCSINSDLNPAGNRKQSQSNLQNAGIKPSEKQRKKSIIDLFKNKL